MSGDFPLESGSGNEVVQASDGGRGKGVVKHALLPESASENENLNGHVRAGR